jgi:hypothetical protein
MLFYKFEANSGLRGAADPRPIRSVVQAFDPERGHRANIARQHVLGMLQILHVELLMSVGLAQDREGIFGPPSRSM